MPALLGSPPRVRGTGGDAITMSTQLRITPACAGNSGGRGSRYAGLEDHPRVCGEQFAAEIASAQTEGSPPRVRGTAAANFLALIPVGITPACAGNRTDMARDYDVQ